MELLRTSTPPPKTPSPIDVEMNKFMLIDIIMQLEFKFVKDPRYSKRKSELMDMHLEEVENIYIKRSNSKKQKLFL